MGLEAADLARWTPLAAKGGIGKCVAWIHDLMFVEVCCCLLLSASFAPSFEQGDEIIVLLQIPDLDNFFLVRISMYMVSRTLP
jgi:hypothetical protein